MQENKMRFKYYKIYFYQRKIKQNEQTIICTVGYFVLHWNIESNGSQQKRFLSSGTVYFMGKDYSWIKLWSFEMESLKYLIGYENSSQFQSFQYYQWLLEWYLHFVSLNYCRALSMTGERQWNSITFICILFCCCLKWLKYMLKIDPATAGQLKRNSSLDRFSDRFEMFISKTNWK